MKLIYWMLLKSTVKSRHKNSISLRHSGVFLLTLNTYHSLHKKFSIKDFISTCDQIRSFLWIWSHLLKKSLMKNFIFCAVFSDLIKRNSCPLVFVKRIIPWNFANFTEKHVCRSLFLIKLLRRFYLKRPSIHPATLLKKC